MCISYSEIGGTTEKKKAKKERIATAIGTWASSK